MKNKSLSYLEEKALNNIKRLIEYDKLIEKSSDFNGINLVIGLSGGPDSTFLSYMVKLFKDSVISDVNYSSYNISNGNKINVKDLDINIKAVHINHMIREEANDDEEFSKSLAEKLDIDFESFSVDVESESKTLKESIETVGRNYRYKYFSKVLEEMRNENGYPSYILTAHIADDNAETVFMNIVRGTNKKGLLGISEKTVNKSVSEFEIIRPLINVYKKDILNYLKDNDIKYIEDKSNFEDVYTRNKVRNTIFKYIDDMGVDVKKSINSLSEKITLEEEYLEKLVTSKEKTLDKTSDYIELIKAADNYKNILNTDDEFKDSDLKYEIFKILDLKKIINEDTYMIKRIIEKVIRDEYTNLDNINSKNIEDILALVKAGINGKKISPNKNLIIYIDRARASNRSKRSGDKVIVFLKGE